MSSAYDSVFHVPEGSMTEEELDRKVNLARVGTLALTLSLVTVT